MNRNPAITTAVRRSDQVLVEQIAVREALACGYAYANADFPSVPQCHVLTEVMLEGDCSAVVETVDGYYRGRGARCGRWAPARGQPVEPLEALLRPAGFVRVESVALGYAPRVAPQPSGRFRILSGRAMSRAYASMVRERSAPHGGLAAALAAVQLERLDDAQYEPFVALDGDQPVGMAALLHVGEIGRVCDVFVSPRARQRGVASDLVACALRTALRWSIPMICAKAARDDAAGAALLRRAEFEECGTIAALVRPEFFEVGG
ncbi:MAG: GNAT family N-acetyltransferase [Phycisphaerae bacterium]